MDCLPPSTLPPQLRRELAAWARIEPIPADGSDRRFFRLHRGHRTCICLYHPHPPGGAINENDSYYCIGRHLRQQGLPVPEILLYCREEGWFLLEDLGSTSLQEVYQRLPATQDQVILYRRALALLLDLQLAGTQGFNPSWCFDTPCYDVDLAYTRECQYFQQAFLQDYLGWPNLPGTLPEDFAYLLEQALAWPEQVVIHRDFQSRNLLVQADRLGLVDFQGARLGPPQYDLAALLLDPYVSLPVALQDKLLGEYVAMLQQHRRLDPEAWQRRYHYLAICRNLQILGAYGFLTRQKGKPFFQAFIPRACDSLVSLLNKLPPAELPTLRRLAFQARAQVQAGVLPGRG